MIRATTPLHTFVFPVDPETEYDEILITYAQDSQVILNKHKSDLSFSTEEGEEGTIYTASLRLTQEETNLFRPNRFGASLSNVRVQVRARDPNGNAVASQIETLQLSDVLNDEVLP